MTPLIALVLFARLPDVRLLRTPGGGIQPQAVRSDDGRVHLLYFKGAPEAGDLLYITSRDDGSTWTAPIAVSNVRGSATAIGNIRGGQLAVNGKGDAAIVWNGSQEASKALRKGGQAPLMFSYRSAREGGFTKAIDVSGTTRNLDGGATVAFDGQGTVGIFWHAASATSKGESERAVWMARWSPMGLGPVIRLGIGDLGACGCCSMKALGNADGYTILYRSATDSTKRDTWRITTSDGVDVQKERVDPWNLNACPMSSFGLAFGNRRTWMAWETEGKVRVGFRPGKGFTELSSSGRAKHPTLATSGDFTLCAWTEGMGWGRGGTLQWAILDGEGKVVRASPGSAGDVPVWSLVTAFASKGGDFTIVY